MLTWAMSREAEHPESHGRQVDTHDGGWAEYRQAGSGGLLGWIDGSNWETECPRQDSRHERSQAISHNKQAVTVSEKCNSYRFIVYCLPDIFICILGILFSSILTAAAGMYRWPDLKSIWLPTNVRLYCNAKMIHSAGGTVLWILSFDLSGLLTQVWSSPDSGQFVASCISQDSHVVTRVKLLRTYHHSGPR